MRRRWKSYGKEAQIGNTREDVHGGFRERERERGGRGRRRVSLRRVSGFWSLLGFWRILITSGNVMGIVQGRAMLFPLHLSMLFLLQGNFNYIGF